MTKMQTVGVAKANIKKLIKVPLNQEVLLS